MNESEKGTGKAWDGLKGGWGLGIEEYGKKKVFRMYSTHI